MAKSNTINVQFGKQGFYHAAFGRMGRGDAYRGRIYSLPAWMGDKETVSVPVLDPVTMKGNGKTKKITRYKHLPSSAIIIEAPDLEDALEEQEQGKPAKTAVISEEELAKAKARSVAGRGAEPAPDSAQKRTTGSSKKKL